jgi:hypothetical protein
MEIPNRLPVKNPAAIPTRLEINPSNNLKLPLSFIYNMYDF